MPSQKEKRNGRIKIVLEEVSGSYCRVRDAPGFLGEDAELFKRGLLRVETSNGEYRLVEGGGRTFRDEKTGAVCHELFYHRNGKV